MDEIDFFSEGTCFGDDPNLFFNSNSKNTWTLNSASMTDKPEQLDDNGDTALTYAIQNAPSLTKCILQKNKDVLLQTPNQDGLSPIALAAYMCSPDVCSLDSPNYEINFSLLRYLIEQENVNINQPSRLEKTEDIPNISSQKNLYANYCDQPITALDLIDFIFANKKLEIESIRNRNQDHINHLTTLNSQQQHLTHYLQNNGAQRKAHMPDLTLSDKRSSVSSGSSDPSSLSPIIEDEAHKIEPEPPYKRQRLN